jgi:hypothetical protein
VTTCADGVVWGSDLAVTVSTDGSWVWKLRFLVWGKGELGGRGCRDLGRFMVGSGWGILVHRGVPSLLVDERGQVSRMVGVRSEVLVNDIGLSVPVFEGAFGFLSDNPSLSREVFHDSWRCLAG